MRLAISPDDGSLIDPNTGLAVQAGDPRIFNGFIQCGAGGAPTGCLKNKLMNPAPRIGFAFDPHGDGKMAIRGGYGIFFEHENGNEANAEVLQQGASPLTLSGDTKQYSGLRQLWDAPRADRRRSFHCRRSPFQTRPNGRTCSNGIWTCSGSCREILSLP